MRAEAQLYHKTAVTLTTLHPRDGLSSLPFFRSDQPPVLLSCRFDFSHLLTLQMGSCLSPFLSEGSADWPCFSAAPWVVRLAFARPDSVAAQVLGVGKAVPFGGEDRRRINQNQSP